MKIIQLIRNLYSEVIELNAELSLLKKMVGLGERELEEYQDITQLSWHKVISFCFSMNV